MFCEYLFNSINFKYMILNYLIDNLLPIAIAIGGAVAWFTESRKRKAETKGVEVVNKQGEATAMQGMQAVYDKFVEDVKTQIAELRAENAALRTEIAEVKRQAEKERKELTSEVNELKAKNTELMAEIEKYVKELKQYRKETKK